MQEEKDKESAINTGSTNAAGQKTDSDATSSETLSEIEETEKVPEAKSGAGAEGRSSSSKAPSPDGAFDDERTSGDDAGPM
jgi:hypothetical protein